MPHLRKILGHDFPHNPVPPIANDDWTPPSPVRLAARNNDHTAMIEGWRRLAHADLIIRHRLPFRPRIVVIDIIDTMMAAAGLPRSLHSLERYDKGV